MLLETHHKVLGSHCFTYLLVIQPKRRQLTLESLDFLFCKIGTVGYFEKQGKWRVFLKFIVLYTKVSY